MPPHTASRIRRAEARSRARGALALLLATSLGAAGVTACTNRGSKQPSRASGPTLRYRLLLRENPVDPGEAFRCYGSCQEQSSPKAYLDCLSACPGFEITPDEYCSATEVPPVAACLTVRKLPRSAEPDPGMIVLGVVAGFLLVVTLNSLCAASTSQCGYYYPPPH